MIEESTLLRAFGSDDDEIKEAREEIISSRSLATIERCVELARGRGDAINVEFWLMELAKTWIDVNASAGALIQLFDEIWEPQGRFHEALLYLTRIENMLVGSLRDELATRVSRSQQAVSEGSAFVISDGWKSWTAEVGFDSPQKSFDSLVSLWMSRSDERVARRAEGMKANFVLDCSSYMAGFMDSASNVNSEIAHAAYGYFLSTRFRDLKLNPPISDVLPGSIHGLIDSTL